MNRQSNERGATLVVGLIMLVVLTLLVLSGVRSSNVNLRVAGNMQKQAESSAAAQQAIEAVISNDFTADLAAVPTPVTVDVNNDGVADYTVTPSASCLSAAPVKMSDLDPATTADKFCFQSASSSNSGMIGGTAPSTGNSVCNQTQWDVAATAQDPATGATTEVHQGISMRVGINITCP
jgi:Tfp pilus assembly protein PilX